MVDEKVRKKSLAPQYDPPEADKSAGPTPVK